MNENVKNLLIVGGFLVCIGGMVGTHSAMKDIREDMKTQAENRAKVMESDIKDVLSNDPAFVFKLARRGGELARIDAMVAEWKADAAGMEVVRPGEGVLTRGAGGVPVTLFTNFDCPYCRRAHKTLEGTEGISLTVRLLPNSEAADMAARVFLALAAKSPDNAWGYYDELMGMQDASGWNRKDANGFTALGAIAGKHGLTEAEFRLLPSNEALTARLRKDTELAGKLGLRGTPFFILNGKVRVNGAIPEDLFRDALKISSGKDLKAGASVAAKDAGKDAAARKKDVQAEKAGSLVVGGCAAGKDCEKK